MRAVVRDVAVLAGELRLPAEQRAVLTIAAGARHVVYDGYHRAAADRADDSEGPR